MKGQLCVIAALGLGSLASAAWSTFHGNNRRDGRTTAVVAANPVQKWTCNLNGPMLHGPVLASDGTIYVINQDESKQPANYLNAINPNGTIRWRYALPWIDDLSMATPAVGADGRIYGGTASGYYFCVDSTGLLVWSHQAAKPINHHTLVAGNGTIYCVLDQQLTAFSPSGTILWQRDLGEDIPGGPTEGLDGNIYMAGVDGIRSYTPTGTLRWTAFASRTLAPVAVAPNGNIISFGTWAHALSPITGETLWMGSTYSYGTYCTPGIDTAGNIYHGSDYNLFKVAQGGTTLVDRTLDVPGSNYLGHTWSSPVIDGNGRLFWSLGNGKRSAIDFEKRVQIFNSQLAYTGSLSLPEIPATSGPAIGDNGRIYVGCLDGKLYCFGE
ncbi:MAG TPA: PQQ-binding-like beta-propeller repeat protein [Fimbriimonadaceae bacterium]|nr:PQQ-binding-like beta-propeller repeat protein [Fimbriimonadaceae bacterium]